MRAVMVAALCVTSAAGAADKPRLALVIDDVGLREEPVQVFLEIEALRGRLTWAVIPGAPYAVPVTRRLVEAGEAVIAHLPMEPADPAHLAPHLGRYLRTDDPPRVLRNLVTTQLATFPPDLRAHIRGANNHQGSGLTAHAPSLRAVLLALKAHGLYFLDSRTTAETHGARLSGELGVPFAERDVFLDNEREVPAIVSQLDRALTEARRQGHAVAIGHPYPETAMALAFWLAKHHHEVDLVRAETLLRGIVRRH